LSPLLSTLTMRPPPQASCSFQRVKSPMWRVLPEDDPQCQKREERQAGG
jgi:hypothetical protein